MIEDDDAFKRADDTSALSTEILPRLNQGLKTRVDIVKTADEITPTKFIGDRQPSAEAYLELMSNKCPLDQIYRVVKIGHKDESLPICPILVKITDDRLKEGYYNAEYLLQCWDNQGRLVYQRPLLQPHLAWTMSAKKNTFIYVLGSQDEPEPCFHIVQINECVDLADQDKVEFKVKDWTGLCKKLQSSFSIENLSTYLDQDDLHISLTSNMVFVVANEDELHSLDLSTFLSQAKNSSQGIKFEVTQESPIGMMKLPKKLHWLWEDSFTGAISAAFSSSKQELLDFYEISFKLTDDKIIAEFQQTSELSERKVPIKESDKIKTVNSVSLLHQGSCMHVAAVLRDSSNIDLYWNGKLVHASEDASLEPGTRLAFTDVHVSFDEIYLRKEIWRDQRLMTRQDIKIALEFAENISIDKGEVTKTLNNQNVRFFLSMKIHKHYKPFQHFVDYCDYLCVSHGSLVSVFNSLSGVWERHFPFKRGQNSLMDSKSAFDYKATNNVVCMFLNSFQQEEVCLYLQDGTFQSIFVDKVTKAWKLKKIQTETKGNIVSITRDKEHFRTLLITTRDLTGQLRLYCFYQRVAIELEASRLLKLSTRIVPFFSPADTTQFLLLDIKDDQSQDATEGLIGILNLDYKVKDRKLSITSQDVQVLRSRSQAIKSLITNDRVHSAVSTSLDINIILFDYESMFVISMKGELEEMVVHQKILIQSLHLFDDRFLYVLYNNQMKQNSNGFGILDLQSLNTNPQMTPFLLPISDAIGGINNELLFCDSDKRISYLRDYDTLVQVPLLHTNTIVFQSIKARSKYMAFRTVGESFIALDLHGRLFSWDTQTALQKIYTWPTGERMPYCQKTYTQEGYQKWETTQTRGRMQDSDSYQDSRFNNALLFKTNPEPNTDSLIKEFYGTSQNECLGKSFAESLNQTFHWMKLIRIVNETMVKEVCTFMHVRLLEKEQHFFFTEDGRTMLEIADGDCRLYKLQNGRNFMQLASRLSKVPKHLANGSIMQIYSLFSPDLTQYFDYDIQSKEFVIRDVLSGGVKFRFPKSFLATASNTKQVSEQLKFMAWVNNDTVRLINIAHKEPIEKLVKTSSLLLAGSPYIVELATGTIPFFDRGPYTIAEGTPFMKKTAGCNFFTQPVALANIDTTNRLRRLHQNFKRFKHISGSAKVVSDTDVTSCLFQIDCTTDRQVMLNLPFTFFHWRLIEYLADAFTKSETQPLTQLEKFQANWLADMTLNILPNQMTMLHMAANKIELLKFIQSQLTIQNITEVPFISNSADETPLHLNFNSQLENTECASFFLAMLKSMPVDHHGRSVANIIYKCLQYNVPGTQEYLAARLIETSQFLMFRKMPESTLRNVNEEEPEFVTSLDMQPDSTRLETLLFEPGQLETNVVIKVLDIPYIHCPDRQESRDFCITLEKSFNEALFKQTCVTGIISYRWDITYQTIRRRLFVPYILYAVNFGLYVVFKWDSNPDQITDTLFRDILLASLLVLSVYFLWLETFQASGSFKEYLKSPWNYLDFVPPSLVITIVTMDVVIPETTQEVWFYSFRNAAHAVIALMLCLKLFYFLRIFRKTGYFISMLVSVVTDARYFFLLYFLIHVTFFFSFAILTQGEYSLFDVFLMSNGEYNLDGWDSLRSPATMTVFFVLAIFTINVVMLNILIAIVGSAYEKVVATQRQFSDLERLSLINENQKFVPREATILLSNPNEYLVIAQAASSTDQ